MAFLKMILFCVNIIVRAVRRALCCFSRRRKLSFSEPIDSLQSINVVSSNVDGFAPLQRQKQQQNERDWNSWDDSPRTVEEHIEQYRQRMAKPPTPQIEEPEPDFFSELTPEIKPQLKYYLGSEDTREKTDFSRLEAKLDVPIGINADLEDWVDEDPGGWEELDSERTKQMIREKRREMRGQRQKSNKTNGIETPTTPRQETNRIAASRLSGVPHNTTRNHT